MTATANVPSLAKRIDDARVGREVYEVVGHDRRGLQRSAKVRPPQLFAGLRVVGLGRTVKTLDTHDRSTGHRRGGDRTQWFRLPDLRAVVQGQRIHVTV